MSDNQFDDLNDDATETDGASESKGMKSLRDALEKANAKIATFETEKRTSVIEKAVSGAGLPPAAVELAALQVKDLDELDKWIEEKRGRFGGAATPDTTDAEEAAPAGGKPSLSPEQIQQIQSTQVDIPSQFQPGAIEAQNAELQSAGSREELLELLRKQGRLEGRSLA